MVIGIAMIAIGSAMAAGSLAALYDFGWLAIFLASEAAANLSIVFAALFLAMTGAEGERELDEVPSS